MSDDPRPTPFDPDAPTLATPLGPGRLRDQPLLRLLAVNWLIGAAVAVVITTVVVVTDTAHLRSLMLASSEPWIPMLLLFFGFFVTMCSVAMATAVMTLPSSHDDDDRPGGGSEVAASTVPAFAPAVARRGRVAPRR